MRESRSEFSLGFLHGLLGQLFFFDLGPVFLELDGGLIGLPKLLLDGLELLAQVVLPLPLVHVSLDLGLNLVAQLQNFQLMMKQLGNRLEAFGGILYLQNLLFFFE